MRKLGAVAILCVSCAEGVDHDPEVCYSGQISVGALVLQGDCEADEFLLTVPRPGTVWFISRGERAYVEAGGYEGTPSPVENWYFYAPGRYRLRIWWTGPGSVEVTYDEDRQWETFDA